MRTYLLIAMMFLAVLIGCKKRGGGSERTPGEVIGLKPDSEKDTPGAPALPPPPATYPDTVGGKIAKALDEGAAKLAAGDNGVESFMTEAKKLSAEKVSGVVRGIDASADRELIDAAFERWWREVGRQPMRQWEDYCDRHGKVYVERKIGTYEQGWARGNELYPKPHVTRILAAGDVEVPSQYAEANASGAVRSKWSAAKDHVWASGRIDFREALEIEATSLAGARLQGSVPELRLSAKFTQGPCYGDFVGLKTGVVVVGCNGSVLRVGPEVAAVRYEATLIGTETGVLLLRGVNEIVVQSNPNRRDGAPVLTVIRY